MKRILLAVGVGFLGACLLLSTGEARDPLWDQLPWQERLGLDWYEAQAKTGDPEAQYRAGRLYELGVDTERDLNTARHWYEKAAGKGHARAQFRLALMQQRGQGGPQDLEAAVRWYEAAAAQGIPEAMHNLAVLKQLGLGTGPDPAGAAALYRHAAQTGFDAAALALGQLLASGWQGRSPDPVNALAWTLYAGERGAAGADEQRRRLEVDMSSSQIAAARELAKNLP